MENSNYKNKNVIKYPNTWLINYIPELIRKSESDLKDTVISLFETNTPKQTLCRRREKLSKPKTVK